MPKPLYLPLTLAIAASVVGAATAIASSPPRSTVEVALANGTARKEVVRLMVYERGTRPDGQRTKLYDKPVIIGPMTEHPPQVLATVPLGHYTEMCAEPRAYPGRAACRTYRQTNGLRCDVALVPGSKEPEIAISCR